MNILLVVCEEDSLRIGTYLEKRSHLFHWKWLSNDIESIEDPNFLTFIGTLICENVSIWKKFHEHIFSGNTLFKLFSLIWPLNRSRDPEILNFLQDYLLGKIEPLPVQACTLSRFRKGSSACPHYLWQTSFKPLCRLCTLFIYFFNLDNFLVGSQSSLDECKAIWNLLWSRVKQ